MPIYNVIEYTNNYSKTSESLWKYYKNDANDIIKSSKLFKSKIKITGKTSASKVWKYLKITLINCEISFILTWSETCVISSAYKNQNLQ